MREPATVVGGSVASLAAAVEASRRGRAVTLFLDPARAGGDFAGVQVAGRRADLGCRLLELDYEEVCPMPAAALDPARHSHRGVIGAIAAFVHGLLPGGIRRVADPELWINGRRIRCPLMTVDVAALPAALSARDRAQVLAELEAAADGCDGDVSLAEASAAQHGPLLHRLLTEAICAKQWAGWPDTVAAERRKLWSALFHAQTLREAFSGLPTGFRPHRPFSTTPDGTAAALVRRLLDVIGADRRITVRPVAALTGFAVQDGVARLRFGAEELVAVPAETLALGVPPEQLLAAAGIPYAPERLQSAILWAGVAEHELRHVPSALTIAEPGLAAFRITPAGPGRFAVEFGAAAATREAAVEALERTGLIREGAAVRVLHQLRGPAQVAPGFANRALFRRAAERFQELGFRGALLGGMRRFGWGSLNDQIADALQFGATRC